MAILKASKTNRSEVFLLKKGGVTYKDLSTIKSEVVNDSDAAEKTKRIKEVDIVKVGSVKLVEGSDKQITSSRDAYLIFKDFWQVT